MSQKLFFLPPAPGGQKSAEYKKVPLRLRVAASAEQGLGDLGVIYLQQISL